MTHRPRALVVHPGSKFNRVGGARLRFDDDALRTTMVRRVHGFALAYNEIDAVANAFADFTKHAAGQSRGRR